MAEWEQDIQRQVERDDMPPVVRQQSRLGVANRNRQRREGGAPGDAHSNSAAASAQPLRPLQAQRPIMAQQQQQYDDDDPFAAHAAPSPAATAAQQPFVHPLMAEPLRAPSQFQQQQQQQQQQQPQQHQQQYESERDPGLRRIESTLRSTLDRPASTLSSGTKQLPPLGGRPAVPPLRLGDVINKVLGPRALTNPAAAPAASQDHRAAERLRAVVRNMRLHESVNPAASGQAQYPPGVDAEEFARAGAFIDDGASVDYDENDDESIDLGQAASGGGGRGGGAGALPLSTRHAELAQHDDEKRPLSPGQKGPRPPREPLPTSRLPIQPEDLARRPEELLDSLHGARDSGGGGGGGPARREDLMHFRVNQAANGGGISNTTGGLGGAGAATSSLGSTAGPGAAAGTKDASSLADSSGRRITGPFGASQRGQIDAFVESKTTGEFIRVRKAPTEGAGSLDHGGRGGDTARNVHNLSDFDAQIDTIIDHVNGIQAFLNSFWLLVSGLLVGVCLLQVYMVYLKSSDLDFLTYYSAFAGPFRKVVFVLGGFSATLSLWRYSLERHDGDRHAHFISRFHSPNAGGAAWWRNVVCAAALSLAFLLTLIMVPVEDYVESRWNKDKQWYTAASLPGGELPPWLVGRLPHWYAMSLVRLLCVSIAWLAIVARFGGAEHWYLGLAQEKNERRIGAAHGSYPTVAANGALSRTSRSAAAPAMGATASYYGGESSGVATARSSRVSSHAPLHATGNAGALRMDSTQGATMMVPPRR